jgi:cell division protein FtsZ
VLINITGGPDLTLHEVNEAATLIQEEADPDANIIFGAVIDESMGDEVRITVIATGFGEPAIKQAAPRPSVAAAEPRDTRPVRAMGRVIDDELDVPTWQRRNQDAPVAAAASAPAARRGPVADSVRDEEYDIPTFLRRGAE